MISFNFFKNWNNFAMGNKIKLICELPQYVQHWLVNIKKSIVNALFEISYVSLKISQDNFEHRLLEIIYIV